MFSFQENIEPKKSTYDAQKHHHGFCSQHFFGSGFICSSAMGTGASVEKEVEPELKDADLTEEEKARVAEAVKQATNDAWSRKPAAFFPFLESWWPLDD